MCVLVCMLGVASVTGWRMEDSVWVFVFIVLQHLLDELADLCQLACVRDRQTDRQGEEGKGHKDEKGRLKRAPCADAISSRLQMM